jgi:hypothetical protein
MFEYLATVLGMHQADGLISSAQAEETPPAIVKQTNQPRPVYRISREQRFEATRKRFEQQLKDDEKTPDPYADMWDPNWINKKP